MAAVTVDRPRVVVESHVVGGPPAGGESSIVEDFDFCPPTPPPEGLFDDESSTPISGPLSPLSRRIQSYASEIFSTLQERYEIGETCKLLFKIENLVALIKKTPIEFPKDRELYSEITERLALIASPLLERYQRLSRDADVENPVFVSSKLIAMLKKTPLEASVSRSGSIEDFGGFACVAKHVIDDCTYVTKRILHSDKADGAASRKACVVEGKYLRELDHPNIVSGFGHLHFPKYSVLFMELIDGPSVETLLREGRMTDDLKEQCLREIRSALEYFHAKGLCYGDLKPQHIIYNRETSRFTLIDLGSVRKTGEPSGGMTLGRTPPEAFDPKYRMHRSFDLWSYGTLCFSLETNGASFLDSSATRDHWAFLRDLMDERLGEAVVGARLAEISEAARKRIRPLLSLDPAKRGFAAEE